MSYIGNNPSQQEFAPAVDYFNGTGSATAFTLSRPVASVAQVQVTIENVPQNPSSAFTVSGSTITFTSAPPSGTSNIYVQYTSPITTVIAPGQGTVNTTQLGSSLLVPIASGGTGSASTTYCSLTANVTGTLPVANGGTNSTATAYCSLTTNISGTLPVANGGTGVTASKQLVQNLNYTTGAVATGTTTIPFDDTIPQITEGTQFMSLAITPTSAASKLEISVTWCGGNNTGGFFAVALFQDAVANALSSASVYTGGTETQTITFLHIMTAGTTSATTFRVRAGLNSAGTTTFNGASSARYYGGTLASSITIKEYTA